MKATALPVGWGLAALASVALIIILGALLALNGSERVEDAEPRPAATLPAERTQRPIDSGLPAPGDGRAAADPYAAKPPVIPASPHWADLVRVVDGDTIIVRPVRGSALFAEEGGEDITIRVMGINTPETNPRKSPGIQPYGPEATEFTKRFLAGKRVRLEYDNRHLDKYGRTLAYVYVGDTMLNEELLRHGLASVDFYAGDSEAMKLKFEQIEAESRQARRGLWSL